MVRSPVSLGPRECERSDEHMLFLKLRSCQGLCFALWIGANPPPATLFHLHQPADLADFLAQLVKELDSSFRLTPYDETWELDCSATEA